MDEYERLATRFVDGQRSILGVQAGRIADGIEGVQVDADGRVRIDGCGKRALTGLCEEFRSVLGDGVENSLLEAARELDQPVALPPSLSIDCDLAGYLEYRNGEEWEAADSLDSVDLEQEVWAHLCGFDTVDGTGPETADGPIAEERGVPMDASEQVYEAWLEQKRAEEGIKVATGHTWLTADEIPESALSRAADDLLEAMGRAKERFGPDSARLILWLRYEPA